MFVGECRKEPNKIFTPISKGQLTWSPMFYNLPYLAKNGGVEKSVRPANGGKWRWYVKSSSETHIGFTDWRCSPGEIRFTKIEMEEAKYRTRDIDRPFVFINPAVKNSYTQNKDWGQDKWVYLAKILNYFQIPMVESPPLTSDVYPARAKIPGVKQIGTKHIRKAFAIMSLAKTFVSTEGAIHHGAAALGLPGIVIFGGFISPQTTGYDMHVNMYPDDPRSPCGNKQLCNHCQEMMEKIDPRTVAGKIKQIIGSK